MIIISSGFPKSASTLLFLYTEHLIQASGKTMGQKIFRRFNKEGFAVRFTPINSAWYLFASLFGPVVVKTHSGPCRSIRMLVNLGLARGYYSVRDPRDAVLSAMDHARKAREQGIKTDSDVAFAPFKKWEDIFPAFRMHYKRFRSWMKFGKAIFPRYEDVISKPDLVLGEIANYVKRPEWKKNIPETVQHFASTKSSTKNYNRGDITRYRNELSEEQIKMLEIELGEYITGMGYSLHNA